MINKKSLKFLESYLNNNSPTGYESEGQKLWLKYLSDYIDEWHLDNYGTAYGIINPGQDYKVVIEAHADEISWFVSFISEDGFIYVIRNGGSDHAIAPAKRVRIHTRTGVVKGVFGWPAIHLRKGADAKLAASVDNIFIDVGAKDAKEAKEMGIHVGAVVTFDEGFEVLNDHYFIGRALDNRMGGFMIAEVARMIKEKKVKLPYSLYIVNSVQEEIGLKGATMIANTIQPDVAIVTDVTHDTNIPLTKSKRKVYGDVKIGAGPAISYAPAVHTKLMNQVFDVAEKHEIPVQREANSRATGTDTDAFAYSNKGVPSVLISLPMRYMHTTVEMVHKSDVEQTVQLIFESLKSIKKGQSFKHFDSLD